MKDDLDVVKVIEFPQSSPYQTKEIIPLEPVLQQ